MTTPLILNKIKLLLNLSNSSVENEAIAAKTMADKLINKYSVTEEEIKGITEEKKPVYGEEAKLYSTLTIEGWRNQLALGVSTKYDCFLVQEEAVPAEGLSEFSYFVIGDPVDVTNVKFAFHVLEKKVEELILKNCLGKSADYSYSYSEGIVEGIKSNLDFIYFEAVPKTVNKPGPTATLNVGDECIEKHKGEKEKPLKESINIATQSFIKDVVAYFRGISDGNRLQLQDILELAEHGEYIEEQLKE